MFRAFLISLFFLGISLSSEATHIVGADITYVCSPGNMYEFTVNIYRDCLPPSQGGGTTVALQDDDPGYFTIYKGSSFFSFDSVFSNEVFKIPANFSNDCINNPPNTCISRMQFKLSKFLPASTTPYTLIYQRCCRNGTVNNIINPDMTGATYSCTIPPNAGGVNCNNSAVFKNFPPQIICVNNPFVYDHSATDADGDSLSYELCDAFKGASQSDSKPILFGGSIPQIVPVTYRSPFSATLPLGGNPILAIDPKTGIMTGTPNILGRFVVSVCCREWRNGVNINTASREFQFVVTNCSKAVVANIPQFSEEPNTYIVNCKGYEVFFVNQSTGGFKYHWDFGVNGLQTDTSSDFQPSYTYPDTGTYTVKLLVNAGTTCPDSITRIVKIYPQFKSDFSYSGLLCPDLPLQFTDLSTSTTNNINYWNWSFDDGNFSSIQNPSHTYSNVDKLYNVTLISGNAFGCRDTSSQPLNIPSVNVFAGNDTVIVKENYIRFNATGASSYTWTPPTNLSDPNVFNPQGYYSNTCEYVYVVQGVTSNKCVGYDTIKVTVSDGPSLHVPTAFSPNGDGINDFFRILASGYTKLNTFKIFDRWGKQIFSTYDFKKGWDGYLNGRICDIGTYFWMITATDLQGKQVKIKGDVSLIR